MRVSLLHQTKEHFRRLYTLAMEGDGKNSSKNRMLMDQLEELHIAVEQKVRFLGFCVQMGTMLEVEVDVLPVPVGGLNEQERELSLASIQIKELEGEIQASFSLWTFA